MRIAMSRSITPRKRSAGRSRGLPLVGLSIALSSLAAPTATAEGLDDAPLDDPIVGGVSVEPGEFDAVVALRAGNQLCTGTVVAPTVVLTAAHCFEDVSPGASITVQFGDDANSGQSMVSNSFGIHPQYCDPCTEEVYDFAYVELPEAYTPTDGFLRPIIDQFEWDEAMRVNNVVLVTGFGTNDPFNQTAITNPTKRMVTTTITQFTSQGYEFFAGGGGRDTCSGDSGGPAIVQLGSGIRRLAGVTSRGKVPCGDGGWYGVPYAALLWLDSQTGTELGCPFGGCLDTTPAGQDEGRCAVGRPSSGGAAGLLALLGLGLLARRRRRLAITGP